MADTAFMVRGLIDDLDEAAIDPPKWNVPKSIVRRFPALDHLLAGVVSRAERKGNTRKAEAIRREWHEIAEELSQHEQRRAAFVEALRTYEAEEARAMCDGGDERREASGH